MRSYLGTTVFDQAIDRMVRVYQQGHRVVLSFSGGKDSTCALEVCIIAAQMTNRLPVEVVMRDEEIMLPGTFEYCERVRQRAEVDFHWVIANQPVINVFNRIQPYFWVFDPTVDADTWVRQPPDFATYIKEQDILALINAEKFPPPPGKDMMEVVGLRVQESAVRRAGLASSGGYLTKVNPQGTRKCRPIYDWTDGDVWKAIKDQKWDYNCNPGYAPIWMGDLSFKPLGDVKEGDEVVGWLEGEGRATLTRTRVQATHKYEQRPVVKVTMESGRTLVCTPDHLWAMTYGNGNTNANWWYGAPETDRCLAHVVDDKGIEPSLKGAWLGGIYDGEGSYQRIYQYDRENGVYREIERTLQDLDIPYSVMNQNSAAQHGFCLTGGKQAFVDFIAKCRPHRREQLASIVLGQRFRQKDKIVAVEPHGVEDVYALTTGTGNYVCWGYASKNSAYDTMFRLGIKRSHLRIGPPTMTWYGLRALEVGHKAWPRWFDRVCIRLPGIRTAVMFGKRAVMPQRRLHESWEDCFNRECITEAPAEWIAERSAHVKAYYMHRHGQHATTPFPEIRPCSVCSRSNASWLRLAQAMYNGNPFALKMYPMLTYMEPEFFREGTGVWGGKPSWG